MIDKLNLTLPLPASTKTTTTAQDVAGQQNESAATAKGSALHLRGTAGPSPVLLAAAGFADADLLEADEEEGDEAQAIEGMLQKIIAKRKEGSVAKQSQLINDTLAKLNSAATSLKTFVTKDSKEAGTAARAAVSKTESSLQSIMKEIEACTEKYQQDMHALWKKYSDTYDQLPRLKQDVKAAAEKRKTAAKRKLSALQTEANKSVADVEDRLNKMRAKSTKLPGVLQVLHSLMEEK